RIRELATTAANGRLRRDLAADGHCGERQKSTHLRRSPIAPARSPRGQQHQFPPPEASARYRFGQRTFAGTRGNERDAPL
ncbi:MAG: hypothetical protein WCA23_01585, partial [Stellaceae bacterium]